MHLYILHKLNHTEQSLGSLRYTIKAIYECVKFILVDSFFGHLCTRFALGRAWQYYLYDKKKSIKGSSHVREQQQIENWHF